MSVIEDASSNEYSELKTENCTFPMILCGDMNSMPSSSVMSILDSNSAITTIDGSNKNETWSMPKDVSDQTKKYYLKNWNDFQA